MNKLFFSLILCATTTNLFAQQEYKGTLQYSDQKPIALADVIILKDDKIIDETSTDENGQFSTNLESGTYVIRIEEAGVLLHSQEIIVNQNQELGLIIVPKSENVTLKETVV
ncbi:MAG: carboxypeptidase regulatory-like domain-containing protein, partial [Algoriella sp.]